MKHSLSGYFVEGFLYSILVVLVVLVVCSVFSNIQTFQSLPNGIVIDKYQQQSYTTQYNVALKTPLPKKCTKLTLHIKTDNKIVVRSVSVSDYIKYNIGDTIK